MYAHPGRVEEEDTLTSMYTHIHTKVYTHIHTHINTWRGNTQRFDSAVLAVARHRLVSIQREREREREREIRYT